MPVFLDQVRAEAPEASRPGMRNWLLLLVLFMMGGCLLSLLFWTEPKEGSVFWFISFGVPVCLWGIVFGLRRIAYKIDQVWAASWNANREIMLNEEILRGQGAGWLIASGSITEAGSRTDKLLSALQTSSPIIQVQKNRAGVYIRHSTLAGFDDRSSDDFSRTIQTLIIQIQPELNKIPTDIHCCLIAEMQNCVYSRRWFIRVKSIRWQPVPGVQMYGVKQKRI